MNEVVSMPPRAKSAAGRRKRNRGMKLLVGLAVPAFAPMVWVGQAWANGCCCG